VDISIDSAAADKWFVCTYKDTDLTTYVFV